MSEAIVQKELLSPARRKGLVALAVLGGVLLLGGALLHQERVWSGALMAVFLLLGLALGPAVFLAFTDATGGRWNAVIRRVPEAMASTLFVSAAAVLVLLWIAPHVYPWAQPGFIDAHAEMAGRRTWFGLGFFSLRALAYVAGWVALTWLMLAKSRRQDLDGVRRPRVKVSIAFLIFFGYSFSLASWDWIMSLDPTWRSTIFGLYCFAGVMQSGFAAALLLLFHLDRQGVFGGEVRDQHVHDLSKWLFAFSCFWAYMWFSQFMLIWFADLPDENQYFLARQGVWNVILFFVVVGRFAVPFFGLASQKLKRNRKMVMGVAVVVLASHWLDLLFMVLPPAAKGGAFVDPFTLLLPLAAGAAFLLLFFRAFRSQSPLPKHEPALEFSREYR